MRSLPCPLALCGLLLLGCGPGVTIPPLCDPVVLGAGEIRIRRVACGDELIDPGEGRRSDWLLENAVARFIVRDVPAALTRLDEAGGGVIDASTVEGSADLLVEAQPRIGDHWYAPGEATAAPLTLDDGSVQLEISGALGAVRYTLAPDSPTLRIDGADTLSVVPAAGVDLIGHEVLDGEAALLGFSGAERIEDLGGWVTLAGATGLTAGDRDTVHEALWPDGLLAEGTSIGGDWAEALDEDGAVVARLPIRGGATYRGRLPPEAQTLRAVGPGHLPGEAERINGGRELLPGPYGALALHVLDAETGTPIPARLHWRGETHSRFPALDPGSPLLTGPGTGLAWVEAGPAYEARALVLSIPEDAQVPLRVRLPRAATPALLADLDVVTAPDPTERRSPAAQLEDAAGRGIGYALMVAEDEVSAGRTGAGAPWVLARTGSRSAGAGAPATWPWSPSSRDPAHGAVRWDGLDADTLLSVMSNRDGRFSIVTPSWLAQASAPLDWAPAPDLLRLDSLDDLDAATALYDAGVPLPLVGPLTWVEGLDPRADVFAVANVERGLLQGRTIASTGPRPVLRLGEAGPGDVLDAPEPPFLLDVRCEAPAWMPLSGAALIGPGGVRYREWALDGPMETTVALESVPTWLVLACWGEEIPDVPWWEDDSEHPWAVTSPLWLGVP